MNRTRGVLTIALLAATLAATAIPAAFAGEPPPTSAGSQAASEGQSTVINDPNDGETRLTLVRQPAWVDVGGTLLLGLRVDGPATPDMTISVTAHGKLSARTTFEASIRGTFADAGTQLEERMLWTIPTDETTGVLSLAIPLQPVGGAREPGQLPMRETGVYPVDIELRYPDGIRRAAGFVTPVVVVEPDPDSTPLNVAMVWPMAAPPGRLADGTPDPAVVGALGAQGTIGGVAQRLAQHDVPVTVVPNPETLELWQQLARTENPGLAATLDSFLSLVGTSEFLRAPYVPLDVPALVANGFSAEVGTELRHGERILRGPELALPVDTTTALVRPVDAAAIQRLQSEQVGYIIVEDEDLIVREGDNLTPATPFLIRERTSNVTALATNTIIARLLDGPDPPALRAQRFLAALAIVAVEAPSTPRGIAALTSPASTADLAVLDAVLEGLSVENPLVAPTTAGDIFGSLGLAEGDDVYRELRPITPANPPVTRTQYLDAERSLNGFTDLLTVPDLRSEVGQRTLLTSLSSTWQNPEGRARAREDLARITSSVDQFKSGIHVPVNPTITLTSRKAEIPVTFLNDTDQTVKVRVELSSVDLTFPGGSEHVLELPPRNTTVRFAVEARGSGTFPLALLVTSPNGLVELQQTEVQVRSTFVSNVGVFLTVGAVLFLALWWGNDFRRRRKRKAAAAAEARGGDADERPPSTAIPGTPR